MNTERYFRELQTHCTVRNFSPRTYDAYAIALKKFFSHFQQKDHPQNINLKEIKEYLAGVLQRNPAQMKQAIAALRCLYGNIVIQPEKLKDLKYPKWQSKIPEVLSHEFIMNTIRACTNKRERAIIATLYATGIRLSELCHLRTGDIDRERMIITVRMGKGGKDRIVPLPAELLKTLEEYWRTLSPRHRSSQWIFMGENPNNYMSPSTVQRIISRKLNAHPHQLRHSYATFLLENKESLKVIGDILGHKSTRTTEIYTHVSRSMIHNAVNPLAA